jgi:hypothetical protein
VASGKGEVKKRRSYRPAVEALEVLRLLSNAAQPLPGIAIPHDLLTPTSPLNAPAPSPVSGTAWDTALDQARPGSAGSDRVLQPIMPLDLPVKVRSWELTVYPRSHIRR